MRFLILISIGLSACFMQPVNKIQEHDLFQSGVVLGYIKDKKLDEISGIAASISNPGCFWVHNDSGDEARVFLIDSTGRIIAKVNIEGIAHRDWEDITVGPGPIDGVTYLYIGEIGDNKARYNQKSIFRFEEPVFNPQNLNQTQAISGVDVINFKYKDGARDAETLMIDPLTKDLFIVSKREDSVQVYALPFPQSLTETILVTREMKLPFALAVAGDISADGNEILIKNYQKVYYFKREPGETVLAALAKDAQELPYIVEQQGEAISWLRNGKGYVTVSEAESEKSKPEIYFYNRK